MELAEESATYGPHPGPLPEGIGIYTTRIRPQAETAVPSPLMGEGQDGGGAPRLACPPPPQPSPTKGEGEFRRQSFRDV